MKKVLLTATVYSHIAQFHKPLINMLKDKGYEIHVAGRNNLIEKKGLSIENVDKFFDIPFSRSPLNKNNIIAFVKLREIINENNYSIVHCNTPMGGIITRLATMKQRNNGVKVIYTAHGFHFYKGAPKKNWLIYYPIEKFFSRYTDLLITITKEDYKLAKEKFYCNVVRMHGVGANAEKFNSDTINIKELRMSLGFNITDFIVLTIGELNKNKNQEVTIKAIKKLENKIPNLKYLLAGNGPNKEYLEKLVEKNNLNEKVIFLGYTTDVDKYMKISDILVSSSLREGLPLNVMEAMFCKRSVIASQNRGHSELITHMENGILFDAKNEEELADNIFKLYKNKNVKNSLISNAYQIIQKYGIDSIAKELDIIYKRVVKNK